MQARHHAEFSRYEWDRPEPKEHDDDSDYDSVCEEDGFSNPDWEKELDEDLTDAKREAMAMWCEDSVSCQNLLKRFGQMRRALGWAQQ